MFRLIVEKLQSRLLGVGRLQKILILGVIDVVVVAFSIWAALAVRLGTFTPSTLAQGRGWLLLVLMPIAAVFVYSAFRLYRIVIRSFGREAAWRAAQANAVLSLLLAAFAYVDTDLFIPRSTPIIFGLLVFCLSLAARLAVKDVYNLLRRLGITKQPVLIYGAGASGTQLAASLESAPEFRVVGFLDDDPGLHRRLVAGRTVYAPEQIDMLISRLGVADVLLAVPSASRARRKEILLFLSERRIRVRTIPSMMELVAGFAGIDRLREVGVDELLGRDSVHPMTELFDAVRGRSVLITGAGGSIGSELCRQAAANGARRIVLFELSEIALYGIEAELRADASLTDLQIVAALGSICDENLLCHVLTQNEVDIVYHAAAYKHVPLVESNPIEGVRNNTLGSRAVARAAIRAGVGRVMLISSDKAVRPTNVMGASKRLAERVFMESQAGSTATIFSMVRFGNVMGSSGSVIPLFQRQIEALGPVTVTHRDITRYFMTIPEAAQLVIQASSMGTGGDLYLLDMGEPVEIYDLARRMIHLSGASVRDEENPSGDIEIKIIGLRAGEKIHEELLVDAETEPTRHPKIFRAIDPGRPIQTSQVLDDLAAAVAELDADRILAVLEQSVEGYRSHGS